MDRFTHSLIADGYVAIDVARGPVVACAIHAGSSLRPSLRPYIALDPADRLREEDPHTDTIARIGVTRVVALHSRFEVDLNRPRAGAVYRTPEEAWGLTVWSESLPETEVERSLQLYDRLYGLMRELLGGIVARHGAAVVFDVHSYNHSREGPGAPIDSPELNPEVNIGTGSLDTARWGPLVEAVTKRFAARGHDVRENVRFRGGHFSAWAHETFRGDVAVLAFEFKKVFMDEWSGVCDPAAIERTRASLAECVECAERAVTGGNAT